MASQAPAAPAQPTPGTATAAASVQAPLQAPASAVQIAVTSTGAAALSSSAQAPAPAPAEALPPGLLLPQAPGPVEGVFRIQTRSAQAPQAVLDLHWAPAEPGDYLIQGYRVWRSGGSGAWLSRTASGPDGLAGAEGMADPVDVGSAYDYSVQAVDVKGHAGQRSPLSRIDLSALPAAQLAPPPPGGLTVTSGRDEVQLAWQAARAWISPASGYKLYRADSPQGLAGALPLDLSGTSYADRPPVHGRPRWYAVASVDSAGRVSLQSLSVSGQATGILPPGAPQDLTTRARTEKVSLAWSAAAAGTAPVSGYILRRRAYESDDWSQVAQLPATRFDYTDKAPGDQGYLYALSAFDSEGNTGEAAYVGASPTARLWNKTLVVLMPTAYANLKDHDRGLNLNVLFDFYVGSLYETYDDPLSGQSRGGLFQPLQIATVTTDAKWSLLDDQGLIPGLAAGLYVSALINFGQPTGAQSVGISSSGGGINTLGNAYAVVSKRFWPGEPRAAIHAGVFFGGLADTLAGDSVPADWRLTLRHLAPGGDFTSLLSRLADSKLGVQVAQAPHLAFAGLQFPFTVPLIFTRWHTGLRLEGLMPLPISASYPASTSGQIPPSADPSTQLPWLLNIHLDNLPLFGFEFGLFNYQGGFQLIAFYHIPDLTWAW